jgi:hypothetical protein
VSCGVIQVFYHEMPLWGESEKHLPCRRCFLRFFYNCQRDIAILLRSTSNRTAAKSNTRSSTASPP